MARLAQAVGELEQRLQAAGWELAEYGMYEPWREWWSRRERRWQAAIERATAKGGTVRYAYSEPSEEALLAAIWRWVDLYPGAADGDDR